MATIKFTVKHTHYLKWLVTPIVCPRQVMESYPILSPTMKFSTWRWRNSDGGTLKYNNRWQWLGWPINSLWILTYLTWPKRNWCDEWALFIYKIWLDDVIPLSTNLYLQHVVWVSFAFFAKISFFFFSSFFFFYLHHNTNSVIKRITTTLNLNNIG